MSDLSGTPSLDDPFDISSTNTIIEQPITISNDTINTFSDEYTFASDTMRFLFVALATIVVLICLTICISVCVCFCLHRRRKSTRQGTKDQRLLPEQSEKINPNKIIFNNSSSKNLSINTASKSSSSLNQTLTSVSIHQIKTPLKPSYFDTVDDIPFIDESRPTSFIDVTRV